ncbi:MAG TPA: hypothetical protein DIU15_16000 [Deltaproteobacteria bacterium]|nr:hypothetical protein [Deltaproteobacteria bacterium]HCP47544.1 hypothetical protein [Deltaproteobacteria bacterium]
MDRPTFFSALLVFVLASGSAHAIQGTTPYEYIPHSEPGAGANPAVQARLTSSPAWQDFLAKHEGPWTVRWDEATATPARFYGRGWPVNPDTLSNDESAFRLAQNILHELHPLLGGGSLPLSNLQPEVVDRRAGITTVAFAQSWRGVPVEDARISLRFKAGRFVMGQLEALPGIDLPRQPAVDQETALLSGLDAMGWTSAEVEVDASDGLRVFPIRRTSSVDHRLTWRFVIRSKTHPSYRTLWVDAITGELVGWRERLRFARATVVGERDDRYPLNGLIESPMGFASVQTPTDNEVADSDGRVTIDGELPVEVSWSPGSEWANIRNLGGGGLAVHEDLLESDNGQLLAVPDADLGNTDRRRIRAQIDAHIALHEVRDRSQSIAPDSPWVQERVVVRVNSDESRCNAWFDEQSRLNFMRQGDGCHNTARIADVVYHEYGHGFHLWNIIPGAGGWGDGSLSEGLSDYLSATITNSPDLAPGFFTTGSLPLRDLDQDLRWPDDIHEDPHITGLIIAGALWDLRDLLMDAYGESAGIEHSDFLYWNVTMRAEEIPDAYEEVLLADDDNGDLADGTPNQCLIDEAFARHGLGPGADAGGAHAIVQIEHSPPLVSITPQEDFAIQVRATLTNPECAETQVDSVVLHYSHDSDRSEDDFDAIELRGAGQTDYEGLLPGAEHGSLVRYYIEVFDDAGDLVARLPEGPVTDPWYGVWVGPVEVLAEFDFEEDDGGFEHELFEGPDQEGADDWQWGPAGGRGGDPEAAFSGEHIWGNDLSPEDNWNGQYQPEVHSALMAPAIDIPDETGPIHLQFRRWLGVEDGYFDQAEVWVNDELLWTQFASTDSDEADVHHQDLHWAFRSYDVTDLVGRDGEIRVRWELRSDGGLEMGGWNLDDIAVVTPGDWTPPSSEDEPYFTGLRAASNCSCIQQGSHQNDTLWWLATLFPMIAAARRRRP